jgi:8-oxo-dGTP diphosphatase
MAGSDGVKVVRVAIGIVIARGRVLICRRKKNDSFGGYWEFPGGKIEAGESGEQAVARELYEELLIRVTPVRALEAIDHRYPTARVILYPYVCRHDAGNPVAIAAAEFAWVEPAALRAYKFPGANAGLLATVAAPRFIQGAFAASGIDLPADGA